MLTFFVQKCFSLITVLALIFFGGNNTGAKADGKMLMKLNTGLNFNNISCTSSFLNTKAFWELYNFCRKNISVKAAN